MQTDSKLGILFKKDVKSKKKETNEFKLEKKFELELKNTNNKRKEERILINRDLKQIKMSKNGILEKKNIVRKYINYKGNKVNIKNIAKMIKWIICRRILS